MSVLKNSSSAKATKIVLTVVLYLICIAWLFPLFYIVMTSFRSDTAVRLEGFRLIPEHFTLSTYQKVLSDTKTTPVLLWFLNSVIVSVSTTVLVVLIASMAAYGYARMEFAGRKVIFTLLMATMMIPGVINLIPTYTIVSSLHLKNTLWALILPALGGVGNIFLIRQFFFSIPKDFDEAATIDGAGSVRVFFQILLPQLIPVLVVVALFTFLGSWNDFLWPLIIMDDSKKRTLTAGLSLLNGQYDRRFASKMAATVISAIPVLLIYLFAQKYLLQGVSLSSGLKG